MSFTQIRPKNFFRETSLCGMVYLKNQKLLNDFGAHIRKLRLAKKMTLEELAYASDIELSQVHRVEKGKTNLSLSTIDTLAKGLEISIGELLKDF